MKNVTDKKLDPTVQTAKPKNPLAAPVGLAGVILVMIYLILLALLLLYGLVLFWPSSTPVLPISAESNLILVAALGGALGSLVHALRSFYWYVGHRALVWSWVVKYILQPLVGATLGLVFYFVIRGGFFPQAEPEQANPYGFLALSSLVGLFSEEAVLKLKQIAETLLMEKPEGEEAKPQKSTPKDQS
jgi:hypothetical protein